MSEDIVPLPKRCGKCGVEFPATLEHFQKDKQTKIGLSSYCKSCKRADSKTYYENNREKVIERTTKYAQEHPEQRKEINRRQIENNRDARRTYAREWAREHRASMTDEQRRVMYERAERYRRSHVDKFRPYYRIYSSKRRALEKSADGSHTTSDIQRLYKSQKGMCWWCGKFVEDNYHVDHRIPLSRGGSNAPDNLCISCPECNFSKGNKLPHEWKGRLL